MLRPLCKELHIPAGKLFLPPGDTINCIYYIKSGTTRHCMTGPDGTEKLLYCLNAGWFFGETALFFTSHTTLSSYAETDVVIYKVPMTVYNKLLASNALFREVLIKGYSSKILAMRYEIENLSFNSCKDRIKRLFCMMIDTQDTSTPGWYNLKRRYTQSELCVMIGAARITINKSISELCDDGFIRMLNRKVQVNADCYQEYITNYSEK